MLAPFILTSARSLAAALLLVPLVSCSGDEAASGVPAQASGATAAGGEGASPGAPGASLAPAPPQAEPDAVEELRAAEPLIRELEPKVSLGSRVEILSGHVSTALNILAQKIQVRDFRGVATGFTAGFRGHDLFSTPFDAAQALPLGCERKLARVDDLPVVDRDALVASIAAYLGHWRRVEESAFHLKAADFQVGDPVRLGRAEVSLSLVGVTELGGRDSIHAHLVLALLLEDGRWLVDRLELEDLEVERSDRPLFSDVSRSTGIDYEGVRYGQVGNDSDAWNGAATADVDGDGLLDVFVPSSERNFLYVNDGQGAFSEESAARGLASPPGGTGAVFFDYDNDGDQDLVVAHVGWERLDLGLGGQQLHFYENEGGRFTDVSEKVGLDVTRVGFSVVAFDYDRDGFVDLFVCGYGRMEAKRNNSWMEANNGSPNTLFRNVGGERFEDVTLAAGLADTRWSYAAASADYDLDGWPDLYVANNFGSNRMYRNTGEGRFEDRAEELGVAQRGNSMGVAFGDLNNDGRLDLYVVGPASSAGERIRRRMEGQLPASTLNDLFAGAAGNALFLGTADGGFERAAAGGAGFSAGWAWSSAIADFDLDGALDVFCVNGFVTGDLPQDT